MKKKVILFDHDGVLVETEQWYFLANQRAFREIGIELDKDSYLKYMAKGGSIWQVFGENLSKSVVLDQRKKRDRYYQEYLQTENIEIEGVTSVLEELSMQYRMAIVTTAKRVDFELIHKNRSIVQYMDFVLTVEDYEYAKPHPCPYLKGLENFAVSPGEALVVEDSARGLQSAIAAGIDCATVFNEFTQSHDFSGAQYRVNSLSDLLEML